MPAAVTEHDLTDAELWTQVRGGSVKAFEAVVRRHQSALCAVAFSICGNVATSEDLAQEALWAAWQQRDSLEDRERVRPWLCGIVRNLAKNDRRRAGRNATESLLEEVAAAAPLPGDQVVTREEESLLWECLEVVPETYREPLVLFYRELQSVAEVATALEISEDAVKQRLSRGRSMLREQVVQIVEGTLRRSRPSAVFTAAVMTALVPSIASTAKAAAAAGGAAVAKAAAGVGAGAVIGPLAGTAGGLFGAWLGTWVPAQLAPSQKEREYLRRLGRLVMVVSVAYAILLVLLNLLVIGTLKGSPSFLAALIGVNLGVTGIFGVWITVVSLRMAREQQRIRRENPPADPNPTPLRKTMDALTRRWRGRVYQSRWSVFGLPLVHINFSDPGSQCQNAAGCRVARGWIAFGDVAYGVVLAMGGRAVGGIALGGVACGGVALGGLSAGLLSLGGLALGLIVAVGGLGIGGIAIGGVAAGWQAAGGAAFGWDVAVGGLAVAHHAAYGGAALAAEYAVGGGAWAAHANDDAARAVLLQHPLKLGMDWSIANRGWLMAAIVLVSLLPLAFWPLFYERIPAASRER